MHQLECEGDGGRVACKKTSHFCGRLQVPFGIGFEAITRLFNGALLSDAGEHIGEQSSVWMMIKCIGGGEQRRACLRSQFGQLAKSAAFVAAIGENSGEISMVGCSVRKRG